MTKLADIAKALHEARMRECYFGDDGLARHPWPKKVMGDFGYIPTSYVEVAFAQAKHLVKQYRVIDKDVIDDKGVISNKLKNIMLAHLDGVYVFSAREDCDELVTQLISLLKGKL